MDGHATQHLAAGAVRGVDKLPLRATGVGGDQENLAQRPLALFERVGQRLGGQAAGCRELYQHDIDALALGDALGGERQALLMQRDLAVGRLEVQALHEEALQGGGALCGSRGE